MTEDPLKKCEICGGSYAMHDLYPVTLIRNSVQKSMRALYPHVSEEGFLCFPDLRNVNGLYVEDLLKREKGALSDLEKEVIESIKEQEVLSENVVEQYEETLTFGQKTADKMAKYGGSWTFVILFFLFVMGWMAWNTWELYHHSFDPFPYILLNLVLSCIAAIQAPIIMMSQNRQSAKDRLSMENDYIVNLKAELQIRQLNSRLELYMKHNWQKALELQRSQEELIIDIEELKRSL